MSSTAYTQRFLMTTGAVAEGMTYIVPAGYRVVARSLTVYDGSKTTGRGVLWLNYAPVLSRIPGAVESVALEFTLCAYAGEALTLTAEGASTAASCSGYIFRDDEGPIGRQQLLGPGALPLPAEEGPPRS